MQFLNEFNLFPNCTENHLIYVLLHGTPYPLLEKHQHKLNLISILTWHNNNNTRTKPLHSINISSESLIFINNNQNSLSIFVNNINFINLKHSSMKLIITRKKQLKNVFKKTSRNIQKSRAIRIRIKHPELHGFFCLT